MATRREEYNNPIDDSESAKCRIIWIKISIIVVTAKTWQRFLSTKGPEKT